MNQSNLMNEIYNNMCLFTDNVLNRLATTVSFNFDIDSFYSYNETINTAISIMENLINEIFISVLSEEENFKIYTLETEFKIQLDEILKENEIIAERLITNQTLIDSIPEYKRTQMINILNNYRNDITQILKNIINKFQKEYNNRINTTLSNSDLSILENDLNSKIEDLKVRRNNMINFLRKFINLDDKFEIYTYELSVLINLENKLNLERRKSFLENYVKTINRIEDTNYLTKNILNDIENDIDKIV